MMPGKSNITFRSKRFQTSNKRNGTTSFRMKWTSMTWNMLVICTALIIRLGKGCGNKPMTKTSIGARTKSLQNASVLNQP